MCGISGIFGTGWSRKQLTTMLERQRHRGPDDQGVFFSEDGLCGLAQNRLSVIDLSSAGHQPMTSYDGSIVVNFNGEIYNYKELRAELHDYPYTSHSDTEVVLAAYERWGEACLDHFIGMFAILIWDNREQRLFAARDRFGIKPLYYHHDANTGVLYAASEIKTLHAAGVERRPNLRTWATYLTLAAYDHTEQTFWEDIISLPAGHLLRWHDGEMAIRCWYDLAERTKDQSESRSENEVADEYLALLADSVRLRFRSDVPVGINLSSGLDSSVLLAVVNQVYPDTSQVKAFTFVTDDPNYDELPWVQQMLQKTQHPHFPCLLSAEDVPELARSVQYYQDEPFGGIPTLAYARLHEVARAEGVTVLLDGQGMDEQWAGYDYYRKALKGGTETFVQGTNDPTTRPECLVTDLRVLAEPFQPLNPYGDTLRDMQYRDIRYSKIPRGLRFNDRVSMRVSTELREPFLDHRLFELAIIQPVERKIVGDQGKWMLRLMVKRLLPDGVVQAPKRPIQTPQREWLRGTLKEWANSMIHTAVHDSDLGWFDASEVDKVWASYCNGQSDNSFFVWQWISVAMMVEAGAL